MTEYIKVTVQATEPNVINVASSQTTPNLKVTIDPTEQNAKLSRDWAIGEGLIQNEDYSSKTWAAESKSSADLSKMYSEAASLDLNNLENKIIEYDEQLNTTITEGVNTIETLQANSLAEITTNKESALSDITTASNLGLDNIATAETNALNNIDTDLTNATSEIQAVTNSSIEDINKTGLDTKVSKSGDTMTGALYVPHPDYTDGTNRVATAHFVKYILANSGFGLADIVNGNDGYIDFAVGFKVRWGQVTFANGSHTASVTFPQPFATSAPKVVLLRKSGASTSTKSGEVWCRGTSTTSFDLYQDGTSAYAYMWIAIGY